MTKYWFYSYNGVDFEEFRVSEEAKPDFNEAGPFSSFSEAKRDAVSRFELEIRMAKASLDDIRYQSEESVISLSNQRDVKIA